MSVVTAVRYLAEFAAEALRPWEPSRELAAKLLADLPLMVRLRRDDAATADEVEHLVLGRFVPAEPPSVPGVDWAPVYPSPGTKLLREANGDMWAETDDPRRIERLEKSGALSGDRWNRNTVEENFGPLVEVQPDAGRVWDGSVPPGGWVCAVCRTPVESEPCPAHGAAVES